MFSKRYPDGLIDEQPMVKRSDDRNLAVRSSVCLRNQVSKDSRPEIPLFRREKLAGRCRIHAMGDDLASRVIPERALGQGAEAGIVARGIARLKRNALEIARQ